VRHRATKRNAFDRCSRCKMFACVKREYISTLRRRRRLLLHSPAACSVLVCTGDTRYVSRQLTPVVPGSSAFPQGNAWWPFMWLHMLLPSSCSIYKNSKCQWQLVSESMLECCLQSVDDLVKLGPTYWCVLKKENGIPKNCSNAATVHVPMCHIHGWRMMSENH
jgi:hypothetical protein